MVPKFLVAERLPFHRVALKERLDDVLNKDIESLRGCQLLIFKILRVQIHALSFQVCEAHSRAQTLVAVEEKREAYQNFDKLGPLHLFDFLRYFFALAFSLHACLQSYVVEGCLRHQILFAKLHFINKEVTNDISIHVGEASWLALQKAVNLFKHGQVDLNLSLDPFDLVLILDESNYEHIVPIVLEDLVQSLRRVLLPIPEDMFRWL